MLSHLSITDPITKWGTGWEISSSRVVLGYFHYYGKAYVNRMKLNVSMVLSCVFSLKLVLWMFHDPTCGYHPHTHLTTTYSTEHLYVENTTNQSIPVPSEGVSILVWDKGLFTGKWQIVMCCDGNGLSVTSAYMLPVPVSSRTFMQWRMALPHIHWQWCFAAIVLQFALHMCIRVFLWSNHGNCRDFYSMPVHKERTMLDVKSMGRPAVCLGSMR